MNRNSEGMRYPSIDDLLEKMDSKYRLAYTAAKVAKIIDEQEIQVKNSICAKSVGIALEEVLKDRVTIEFKE